MSISVCDPFKELGSGRLFKVLFLYNILLFTISFKQYIRQEHNCVFSTRVVVHNDIYMWIHRIGELGLKLRQLKDPKTVIFQNRFSRSQHRSIE